jgi:cell wall-associated NlpC family hydrolase
MRRAQTRAVRAGGWIAAGLVLAGSLVGVAPVAAQTIGTGGTSVPSDDPMPTSTGVPGKAKLLETGKAIAPSNAPARVVRAIQAANRIRKKPYLYGGGHQAFKSEGYDCSGAVSYVLHAAKMLPAPESSGGLMRWAEKGKGAWITVYANSGHAYAVIAGLRWDTSAVNEPLRKGSGPRWRSTKRSPQGYKARHFPSF